MRATLYMAVAVALLTSVVPLSEVRANAEEPPGEAKPEEDAGLVQKTCPVMVGNKVDPNIFTEYEGKKVYFCCDYCKATFEAEPEKYLDRLPQFSEREEPARETPGFAWPRLIVPFGIGTLSLLVLTFLAGWFMRINRKLLFKWHRRLAIATLAAALCHALLVVLFY